MFAPLPSGSPQLLKLPFTRPAHSAGPLNRLMRVCIAQQTCMRKHCERRKPWWERAQCVSDPAAAPGRPAPGPEPEPEVWRQRSSARPSPFSRCPRAARRAPCALPAALRNTSRNKQTALAPSGNRPRNTPSCHAPASALVRPRGERAPSSHASEPRDQMAGSLLQSKSYATKDNPPLPVASMEDTKPTPAQLAQPRPAEKHRRRGAVSPASGRQPHAAASASASESESEPPCRPRPRARARARESCCLPLSFRTLLTPGARGGRDQAPVWRHVAARKLQLTADFASNGEALTLAEVRQLLSISRDQVGAPPAPDNK